MSYSLSAKIIGDKELKEAFQKAPREVEKHIKNAIDKTAKETQRKAVQYAPHQHGMLQQSITTKEAIITTDNIFAIVSTDKNYARYQEEGTGIHGPKGQMIKRKDGGAMPIRGKNGSVLGWTRKSQGVKAKWFMKRAREEAAPMLTNHMQEALKHILSFLAKG